MLDQDIIAYIVPEGAVGFHSYQGPMGMDFRVGGLHCCRQLRVYQKFIMMVFFSLSSCINKLNGHCYKKYSLHSWGYCKCAQNKVLAAEPTREWRSFVENRERDFEIPRYFSWASPLAKLYFARTIPPATQAIKKNFF